MNTIFLVANGPYLSDVLEGFATNGGEIRQIVANHYKRYQYINTDNLDIRVDLRKKTVVVKLEVGEEWNTTFYIHAIQIVRGD